MTLSFYGPGPGLELIGRQALTALFSSVNTEIVNVSDHWLTLDQELASLRSATYASCILEPIANENFHLCHRPSLLEAPITSYPNISCMAYDAAPDAEQPDQLDKYSNRLYVEVMVKGTEEDGEEVVNKRIQRTTDAVVNVLGRFTGFDGAFPNLQRPARILITDLFVRREEKSRGPRFLWQNSRIEYAVDSYINPQSIW